MVPRRAAGWFVRAALCVVWLVPSLASAAEQAAATPAVPAPAAAPVPMVDADNFLRLKAEVIGAGGIVVASFDLRGLKFAWQQWENVGTGPETYSTQITADQQRALVEALAQVALPALQGRYDDPKQGDVNYHAITLYLRGTGPRPQRFLVRVADGHGPPGYAQAKAVIDGWLRSVVPASHYTHWYF